MCDVITSARVKNLKIKYKNKKLKETVVKITVLSNDLKESVPIKPD